MLGLIDHLRLAWIRSGCCEVVGILCEIGFSGEAAFFKLQCGTVYILRLCVREVPCLTTSSSMSHSR